MVKNGADLPLPFPSDDPEKAADAFAALPVKVVMKDDAGLPTLELLAVMRPQPH